MFFFVAQQNDRDIAVKALKERIQALEVGAVYQATKEEVQRVEADCLEKLRGIRAALEAEGADAGTGASSSSSLVKELELVKAENEALKQKNAKLQYRVKHVVDELEKLYNENKAMKAAAAANAN